jgi:hypothetical protein
LETRSYTYKEDFVTTLATPVSNEVISQLAYDVILEVAAEEDLIFEENRDAYFANPEQALAEEQAKEEMLGFGTEAVIILTPFVLAILTEVVKFLAEELKKALGAEVGEMVKLFFKKYRPTATQQAPPPLTAQQLAQVRKLAFEKGRHYKLSEERANQIANAIIGELLQTA